MKHMKHTQLLSPPCLTAPPPSERSWTNCGKIIDVGRTTSYVLNSGITDPNLMKIAHNVGQDILLPINLLKSIFRYFNPFRNASETNEGVEAVFRPVQVHRYANEPYHLRSYWMEVHRIFTRCSLIIPAARYLHTLYLEFLPQIYDYWPSNFTWSMWGWTSVPYIHTVSKKSPTF